MEGAPEHFMYPRQDDLSKADGVAWACIDTEKDLVKYPFTFPDLEDNEVRIKITYTGLCHSDSLHARKLWGPNVTYPCVPGHEVVGIVT
jgi:D-arabinose 1-dehydrogenase-like Zn-dependent alcohol dehydrogenase